MSVLAPLHASLEAAFYDNLLLVLGIVLPVSVATAFALWWTRALGIHFGPDQPEERAIRQHLARQLDRLGFSLPEELPAPAIPAEREPRGRRVLRLGLAGLWLLGAALVAQPAVGTGSFLGRTVLPVIETTPGWIRVPLVAGFHLWSADPVAMALASLLLELVTGLLLLANWRGAAWWSAFLSLALWALGEGFGGLLSGEVLAGGAPGMGPVLLAASLLLLPDRLWRERRLAHRVIAISGWAWLASAVFQATIHVARPWSEDQLVARWLSLPQADLVRYPLALLTRLSSQAAVPLNLALALAAAAVGVYLIRRRRLNGFGLIPVGLWLLFVWWALGDQGGLWTGQAIDVGAGVAWAVLLAACVAAERSET